MRSDHTEDQLVQKTTVEYLEQQLGREIRTPAMQAGLVARRLSFREIFTSAVRLSILVAVLIDFMPTRGTLYERNWPLNNS